MAKIEGSIPMKPWLAHFALKLENLSCDGRIDLAGNTLIPRIIKMFLTGKTNLENRSDKNKLSSVYSGTIRYTVNYREFNRGRIFLSPTNIVSINQLIYSIFHEMLLQRILFARKFGLQEKEVIHAFLESYDIVPDIDVETHSVKKANYRLRKSKKIDHFYSPESRNAQLTDFQQVA